MTDISIGIILHKRTHFLRSMFELFSRCETKDKFTVYLVTGHSPFSTFYKQAASILREYQDKINVKITNRLWVGGTSFMDTIKCISNLPSTYVLRMDDDLLISPKCIDFWVNNIHILDDEKNICISSICNNNAALYEYFLEDFCTEEERSQVLRHFDCLLFPNFHGIDFSIMNASTHPKWNPSVYRELIQTFPHRLQRMHPICFCTPANIELHNIILNNFDRFLNPPPMHMEYITPLYFANGCTVMKNDTMRKILNDQSLFTYEENDSASMSFDEIAFNKYLKRVDGQIGFARHGYRLHCMYWLHDQHKHIEKFHTEYQLNFVKKIEKLLCLTPS